MKKILSLMLMLALALYAAYFAQPPMPVHADEQEVIKKHIDIGCTQSWSTIIPEADYRREAKTRGWMDYTAALHHHSVIGSDEKIGEELPCHAYPNYLTAVNFDSHYQPLAWVKIEFTLDFGRPVDFKNVYMFDFDKVDFSDADKGTLSFNKNKYFYDKESLKKYYGKRFVKEMKNINFASSGDGKINISYDAYLNAKAPFCISYLMEKKKAAEVYDMMGGEDAVKAAYPQVYKILKDGEKIGSFAGVYGIAYFTPLIIEYAEKENVELDIPDDVVPPPETTGGCKSTVRWNEIVPHTYTIKVGSGKTAKTKTVTCKHVYTYEATMKTTAKLVADKKNGSATKFKSGYGFGVSLDNKITVKQVGSTGRCGKYLSRTNTKVPQPPKAAEVRTNWTVKNPQKKTTQGKIVPLKLSGSSAGANSGYSKFVTAPNKVSNYNKQLIYTDVKLKGTKKKPVNHNVIVYTKGGGVNGVEFCNSVPLTFTINGDMYEDDVTVDRR